MACICANGSAQTAGAAMQIQQAQSSIGQFNQTHAESRLDAAIASLEAAGAMRLRENQRHGLAAAYIALFAAVDRALPNLPPGKLPLVNVVPPRAHGVSYPAGVDPSAIRDPAVRPRYEQEIRDNETFTQRFLLASSLRRIDDRAVLLFSGFSRDAFKSAADRRALRAQIQQSALNRARRSRLLAAVPI
jgi:hypothetical protein